MRKKIILALVVANALMAGSLMAFGGGGVDCCRDDNRGNSYCCEGCCLFVSSCDTDSDCILN